MECFVIVTVLWILSVCLHEFGHAWVAWRGGDSTVAEKGYLTMNPFRYAHPVYSLLLPILFLLLGGIGLPGGAVYINRHLLRSKQWDLAVSLAGPAVNLVLILLLGILFRSGVIANDPTSLLSVSMGFLLFLQVSALILNLLPVPPLDGFQALVPWLPPQLRQMAFTHASVIQLILFVLLWNDTPVRTAFWSAVTGISDLAGVERNVIASGYWSFAFWRR